MIPDDIRRAVEAANRAVPPGVRHALEIANRYAPQIEAANHALSHWRQIEPQVQRLAEEFCRIEEGPRHAIIRTFTFARGGWHEASLMEMTVSEFRTLLNDLVDKPDAKVKEELDHRIPAYFSRNDYEVLWDMVDRWDLYPGWRRAVFEEAFWAHKNEKYILSVCALAPQIEGLLRQETGEYGRGNAWLHKVNDALEFEYDATNPPTSTGLEEAVDEILNRDLWERYDTVEQVSLEHALFRVNELYNNGKFSDPEFVNSTNRHAILHGVSENFGELASIKLFCAVQLVHEIVIVYREATGA
ncbi:hypothetical protein [Rubrobacter indicoceani]|uniref:hypothetical protein n=1 Tax=Rubrobacter indicoceani TaxID=2051957 RepID=UPI0013C531C7|nr:hypothetical protein [Rubrobacter indicoceani]